MLSAMEVLALIFGVVISWRWIPPYIHHILLVIYWLRYRTEFKFGVMYGVTDGYRTYAALLDTVKVADYAEYLRLHNAAQASSYGLFRRYYDDIVNFLLTTLLPIVFLPAIVFWTYWYAYIFGAVVVSLSLVTHMMFVNRCRLDFYIELMISVMLAAYQKEEKQKNKRPLRKTKKVVSEPLQA